MKYNKLAEVLDKAAFEATAVGQLSMTNDINLEQAYAIQGLSMARRYKRGESFVGIKLGFTSRAKMQQMGVNDLIWGRLTDRMQYQENEELLTEDFIHPRAEPEVAFLLSKNLDTKLNMDNISEYISGVCIAIEIIDSRFENFKFSLEDVVADNCSSSGFILGEWHALDVSFRSDNISLMFDGVEVQSGNTSAILGDPMESLIEASRLVIENGEEMNAGDIILAGAATAAEYIKAGTVVSASSDSLGSVSLRVS